MLEDIIQGWFKLAVNHREIVNFSMAFREVLETHSDELQEMNLPFFFSFPENCCQGASVLLGVLIHQFFRKCSVRVIKGTTRITEPDGDYHHFWVEVSGRVYDLTLDQFVDLLQDRYSEIDRPIFGAIKHPLAGHFYFKKRNSPEAAMREFVTYAANLDEVEKVYKFCIEKLQNKGWLVIKK